ncbi:GNAT family N-acetyltransferase [Sphingomonas sp. LM7]|uniref:GNAT family N-acetyltransferase n=1 Tax=Sphingomonas sp. LM7 TaxID=1938607 RepID=UPI000983BBCB|nr:GNAT family N-acetyltransferase [Sphingomonas sp. LM7]AQR74604.1 GNAT family N-acetyltransferase [Sphingomonas sp. LM7]
MNYRISFDPEDQQLDVIHGYLVRSYWAEGIPKDVVARSIAHSLCVGAFDDDEQVGFARVVTDRATLAYLADVFVLEGHRDRGLAQQMLEALEDHPELQGLRRWALFTRDMQPFYAKFGWEAYPHPDRLMVRDDPDIYSR